MSTCSPNNPPHLAVIGAGPAGLMAAEQIANAGFTVTVFDAMPSVARKFLLAGVGGMNITHAEAYPQFISRYGQAAASLKPIIDEFTPEQLRAWIHALGIDTFVGSSNRVFPTDMKAAPLLRRWLHRLRQQGVVFHPRYRWLGFADSATELQLATPEGEVVRRFDAVVLALGGGSWRRLGSDGGWVEPFAAAGVTVAPLQPSNCGFKIAWSDYIQQRYAGAALKNVRLFLAAGEPLVDDRREQITVEKTGEFIVSQYGIEGSLVYALSAPIRDSLALPADSAPKLFLDWLPKLSHAEVVAKLSAPRKGLTLANLLRKKFKLSACCLALLTECAPAAGVQRAGDHGPGNSGLGSLAHASPERLAGLLKAMPLPVTTAQPIDEAISSAGGVAFAELDEQLMVKKLPGVFVAGEMLDWEAPTGGYLLTACFATGRWAGLGAVKWLRSAGDRWSPGNGWDYRGD
ncbi:TIGR03862 family flavoprotein [Halioxenophilus sp. WMMB6]|uniref:NAD(P)/FAD-dependent oxidoreductase n=1 Tax=Halioxenophilus sp. WMMB6 TaxID=3073815 RepID=UPI00295E8787|nr:TIGR03862 family flavoprotein [Halioxenophilus sp. WMMB6]